MCPEPGEHPVRSQPHEYKNITNNITNVITTFLIKKKVRVVSHREEKLENENGA